MAPARAVALSQMRRAMKYGQSPPRPRFRAQFDLAPERAAALALSKLRLAADTAPRTLEEILPKPDVNPVANDLSRNALPYATALAGACPRLAPAANVLPPEHRRFNSRAVFVPTMVLAALLLLVAGSMAAYASYSEKQYLNRSTRNRDWSRCAGAQASTNDGTGQGGPNCWTSSASRRAWIGALNSWRLLEPPPGPIPRRSSDALRITCDAPQTAPVTNILDSSPFFEKTEIHISTPKGSGETFQLRTNRRRGK